MFSSITSWQGTSPLVAALVTFVVARYRITGPEVWYDEVATITSASRSLGQLASEAQNVDAVHSLYYAIMHMVFAVFGYSPLSLRLPSAVAIAATAAFTVVLARQFGDDRRAFLAGLTLCLIPRAIWAGGEGRSYAGTALLAVILTIVLVKAVRSPLRRWWIAYGCVVLVCCLYFAFLAFLLLAHAVTIAFFLLRERRKGLRTAVSWLVATGGASILLLPFALLVRNEARQISWIGRFGLVPVAHQVIYEQWFTAHTPDYTYLLWAATLAGCGLVLWRMTSFSLGSVIVPAAVVPTVGMIVYTIVSTPIYNDRYVTMCVPFVAILIASAVARVRWIPGIAAVLLLFALMFLPAYISLRSTYAEQTADWLGTVKVVETERALLPRGVKEGVIWGDAQITHAHPQQIIQWAYPKAFRGLTDVTLHQTGAERGQLWESRYPLSRSTLRLNRLHAAFFIGARTPSEAPAVTSILKADGWRETASWVSAGIQVVEYERSNVAKTG